MKPRKIGHDRNMPTKSAPVVISLAAKLPSIRLPSPATMAASKGRKTMSWTVMLPPSPLHLVDVVDRDRAAASEVDDEDGEADRRLAGGDGEDEHGEDLPDHVAEIGGEGDQVDVDAQEDELDRHQDDDDVLPVEEDSEHPEHEQDRADGEVMAEPDHDGISDAVTPGETPSKSYFDENPKAGVSGRPA